MLFHQPTNSIGNHNYNAYIYNKCEYSYHFHKNFELIFVIDGYADICIDSREFALRKNEFILVLPNEIHSIYSNPPSKIWIGVFSKDYVSEFANMVNKKYTLNPVFKCTEVQLEYLKNTLLTPGTPGIFTLKSCLYMICDNFLKNVVLKQKKAPYENTAHKIIDYMENNFRQDITLGMIAKELGYEYHYFSRYFKNTFRTSFKSLLNQYRYEYAKELLLNSDKNISDIALDSGFGSIRNFNRIYKEITGECPNNTR